LLPQLCDGKVLVSTIPGDAKAFCPGPLGGVETPMAQGANALFVPWVDMCAQSSGTASAR
jgi:hypothetical protein